jgi:hypothetical protein
VVEDSPGFILHDGTLGWEEAGGAGRRKPSRSLAGRSESSIVPVPSSGRWQQTGSELEARCPQRGTAEADG